MYFFALCECSCKKRFFSLLLERYFTICMCRYIVCLLSINLNVHGKHINFSIKLESPCQKQSVKQIFTISQTASSHQIDTLLQLFLCFLWIIFEMILILYLFKANDLTLASKVCGNISFLSCAFPVFLNRQLRWRSDFLWGDSPHLGASIV